MGGIYLKDLGSLRRGAAEGVRRGCCGLVEQSLPYSFFVQDL